MSKATGIHITSHAVRMVGLERANRKTTVTRLGEAKFETPLRPEDLAAAQHLTVLRDALKTLMPKKHRDPVTVCLPGGLFHIQKVPLEMASAEDRREQIVWEASQALLDAADAYEIDFFPAGRSAFWTAIRREIRDALAETFASIGDAHIAFIVAPLALFQALSLSDARAEGRRAAIHWHPPWLSFAATESHALIAAETVHIGGGSNAPQQILMDQQIRQWVFGDLNADRRKTAFGRVHMCGDMSVPTGGAEQAFSEMEITELPVFAHAEIRMHDPDDAEYLKHPGAFALASGAAFAHFFTQE